MSRTRDKMSAIGLLPRMEARVWADGKTVSYRYHPVGGKPIALGQDRHAAIRKVLDMNGSADDYGTLSELWRAYQESPYWARLAPRTKEDYTDYSVKLLEVMGGVHAALITPAAIVRYLRRERAGALVRANREVALLSNLMNIAIERGDIHTNPCKQVKRNRETPRDHIPDADEFTAFVAWLAKKSQRRAVIATMAEFAAATGYRRTEFLHMTLDQIKLKERVLVTERAKQHGRKVIENVTIPDSLVPFIEHVLALPRPAESDLVFTTRSGNAYTDDGFSTMYQRAQREALEAKVIKTRFTFHDLRAYYTSRHKDMLGTLPDMHADAKTTARVYDRTKVRKRTGLGE